MRNMLPLSPEICRNIAFFLSKGQSSRHDLLALCLTCKPLRHEATPYLYSRLIFTDPEPCLEACNVIMTTQLGVHVHSFAYNPESPSELPRSFWETLQGALCRMDNLLYLVITDFSNSWVLDCPPNDNGEGIRCQLKDIRLHIPCDAHLLRFLDTQKSVRTLQLFDTISDTETEPLPPIYPSLPNLQAFDGPLIFGARLLSGCSTAPVRQVHLASDCERASVLPLLRGVGEALRRTLQNLIVSDLHGEDIGADVLGLFAASGAPLKHIGILPYSMLGRVSFHKHLISMSSTLRSIELDLTRWSPTPAASAIQRVLADELRTYCPSIRVVTFYIGNTRALWTVHNNSADAGHAGGMWDQWVSRVDG